MYAHSQAFVFFFFLKTTLPGKVPSKGCWLHMPIWLLVLFYKINKINDNSAFVKRFVTTISHHKIHIL